MQLYSVGRIPEHHAVSDLQALPVFVRHERCLAEQGAGESERSENRGQSPLTARDPRQPHLQCQLATPVTGRAGFARGCSCGLGTGLFPPPHTSLSDGSLEWGLGSYPY